MIDVEGIAKALDPKARQSGAEWLLRCPNPAHEDKTPSCYITEERGQLLWHCFGCQDKIALRQAIEATGLYQWRSDSRSAFRHGTARDEWFERLKEEIRSSRGIRAAMQTADFFAWADSRPDQRHLIGPLQDQEVVIFAAPPKSGKTMIRLGIGLSLSRGQNFASWECSTPRSVYMLDCEMGDKSLRKRAKALGYNGDERITWDTYGTRIAAGEPPFQLGNVEHHHALMEKARDADVIWIDPIGRCLISQDGIQSLHDERNWLAVSDLEAWARNEGKLLAFTDHTTKDGSQLSGSEQKRRNCDLLIDVERLEPELAGLQIQITTNLRRNDIDPKHDAPLIGKLGPLGFETTTIKPLNADWFAEYLAKDLTEEQRKDLFCEEFGCKRSTYFYRKKAYQNWKAELD